MIRKTKRGTLHTIHKPLFFSKPYMKFGFVGVTMATVVVGAVAAASVLQKGGNSSNTGTTSNSSCPKISQASLNLDTPGCQTVLTSAASEARTSWKLEKSASSTGLTDPNDDPVLYNVRVTQGATKNILVVLGTLVVSNGGEQTPVLNSVILNLQQSGPSHQTVSTAMALKDPACRDGSGVEGGQTCYGQYQNSSGASVQLTDANGNDVTAYLGTVPIPPSLTCDGAVKLNFKAEFDLAQSGFSPGDGARLELLTTFAGAGARGKSPETVSCSADVNCNGTLDSDDLNTCQLNESETNNIRTVKQRASFTVPALTPVCASVNKVDAGATSVDGNCVEATSNSLNETLSKQSEGWTDTETISGTASCKSRTACSTDVVNVANLYCVDGRNELIEGSPASAAIPVVCSTKNQNVISVGDFCTATQGCWGQNQNGFCAGIRDTQFASLLSAFATEMGLTNPAGVRIGDIAGGLNGSSNGFAAEWRTATAIKDYLPNGTPAGALTSDLLNPLNTASGVLGAQLLAAELNVARDDAGFFQKNRTEKLKTLVVQSCTGFPVTASLQGLTVKQLICVANKAVSGNAGCTNGNNPSCVIAVSPPDCMLNASVQASLSELVDALNAVNNNFDGCAANNGCLRLP